MAARRRSVGPREVQIVVTVVSAVILVPWIVYLAVALPRVYVTHNWDEAWVGFDLLLLLLLVATAIFGYLRRQMVMLTAFATGVLLICDAWFDWMTSNRSDVGWATVTALFVELPLCSTAHHGGMSADAGRAGSLGGAGWERARLGSPDTATQWPGVLGLASSGAWAVSRPD